MNFPLLESLLNEAKDDSVHTRYCEVDEKYLPEFEKIQQHVDKYGPDSVKLIFDRSWGIRALFRNKLTGEFDNRDTDMYLKEAYKNPNNKLKISYSYKLDDEASPVGFKLHK